MSGRVLYEINERPGGGWDVVRPLLERIQDFRSSRVAVIAAGRMPVAMEQGPVAVLHMIPNGALDEELHVDLKQIAERSGDLLPLASHGANHRYNADGFLMDSPASDALSNGYLQLFRNGVVETATTQVFSRQGGQVFIASLFFEQEVITAIKRYVALAGRLGFTSPHIVLVTLVGAEGFHMAGDRSRYFPQQGHPIDRSPLEAPPVTVEDTDGIAAGLRTSFDYVWQAAGWSGSHYYRDDGTRLR